jgi:hypothetical protein
MLDDWTVLLDSPSTSHIQAVGLDFSKAFDRLQPNILVNKLSTAGLNSQIIKIIHSFLSERNQCVKLNGQCSNYTNVLVGSPQGTKLGPVLWLLYCNDLVSPRPEVKIIKYADDVTFYSQSNVQPSLDFVMKWSTDNSMLLNANKTTVLNVCLSRTIANCNLTLDSKTLCPSPTVKFLGVLIDSRLSFKDHVVSLVKKCNSRLFFMRVLKRQGLNTTGLITYYLSNVRSILTYASPAWYLFCSKQSKEMLEKVQRTATRIIFPEIEGYENRLTQLSLPTVNNFITCLSRNHFNTILGNVDHPLHKRLQFNNTTRTSSRKPRTFRPPLVRTAKRSSSFFIHYMNDFDN